MAIDNVLSEMRAREITHILKDRLYTCHLESDLTLSIYTRNPGCLSLFFGRGTPQVSILFKEDTKEWMVYGEASSAIAVNSALHDLAKKYDSRIRVQAATPRK